MLVLTRRIGQVIKIGDEVEIVLVGVQGEQARIGIRAPRRVAVVRGELVEEVTAENRAAAEAPEVLTRTRGESLGRPLKQGPRTADISSAGASSRKAQSPGERRVSSTDTSS
jgi:carbon storage regulator